VSGEDAEAARAPAPPRIPRPHGSALWAIDPLNTVLEDIRDAVLSGEGESPVSGALIGSLQRRTIVIESWKPIPRRREDIAAAVTQAKADRLGATGAIGWVTASCGSQRAPVAADLEIFEEFFRESWHVLLVITPDDHKGRAAFYLREPGGALPVDHPYCEKIIGGHGAIMPPPRNGLDQREFRVPTQQGRPDWLSPAGEEPLLPPVAENRRSWIWPAIAAVAMAIAAVLGWLLWLSQRSSQGPFDLVLSDANQQLLIRWRASVQGRDAPDRGALTVRDGSTEKTIELTGDELRRGTATWPRQTGVVRVQLKLWRQGRPSVAIAEFLGSVATPVQPRQQPESPKVAEENAKLRQELERASARAAKAEDLVRILQNRIAVEGSSAPPK